MLFRFTCIVTLFVVSCSSPERPDIVFDDFENANFDNWNKLGTSFHKPCQVDSISEVIENVHGKFFAYSNFEGSGESYNQGKLVSESFIINRKYINFLIAGGKHDTRECVNLIVNNKVVRVSTGANDHTLRPITWDVGPLEGESAVIEIVDAMASDFERNSIGHIIIDHIVFSDNKHDREVVFEDFESGTYNNWTVEGEAFVVPRNRTNVYYPITVNGFNGNFFAFSFGETHDSKQGKLTSAPFTVKHDHIKFLVGGGNHKAETCINLVVNDSVVFSAEGENDGQMRVHQWDVRSYKGQNAKIEIVDHYSGGWGHIMVDDIIFYDGIQYYTILIFLGSAVLILGIAFLLSKTLNSKKGTKPRVEASNEEIEKLEKLKASMESSKIYKQHNPSMDQIVKDSGVVEEEINFLFEHIENTSLSNYINYLRVEEFKRQLKDPSNKAYTMLYIAENCGFNSKTSFYRVFKSVTNMTPSEYKKSIDQLL